jgi:hypothetical protein
MRSKLGLSLMLGLAINMLFSGLAQAVTFNRFNFRLDGIGISVDSGNVKHERMFVSLGKGYAKAKPFNPIVRYDNAGSYSFECGGVKVKNGAICHFKPVKYGDSTQVIKLYKGRTVTNTYNLVFTNLPVIDVTTTGPIVDTPKVSGSLRLMSGEFKQDTGRLPIGIEVRGQTTQVFAKKSWGFQFGTAKSSRKVKLLSMKADDEWILDASYVDTSFARNRISMDIYNEIHANRDKTRPGGQNAIKGHLAEAIVNGKYAGVYVLNQHVGRTLLGLKPAKGSVLYKADFAYWKNGKAGLFFPYNKGDIEFNFSQAYPKTKADFTPLKSLIDFVANTDEYTFTDNIASRIDLASVADWYLLTKATQATDNTAKNFFLAKNVGGKFFIVPWDHNATFGLFWNGTAELSSTFFATVDNNLINRLIKYPDTGFRTLLKSRWAVLKKTIFTKDKLEARFGRYRSQLAQGGAMVRNKKKWPQPGTVGANKGISNPQLSTTTYIDKFLKIRLPAMNGYINSL